MERTITFVKQAKQKDDAFKSVHYQVNTVKLSREELFLKMVECKPKGVTTAEDLFAWLVSAAVCGVYACNLSLTKVCCCALYLSARVQAETALTDEIGMQVRKLLLKADLWDALKNLVKLHKTMTRTLLQSESVDKHCKAIINFMRTKSFSLNHVADVLQALYPSRNKMSQFVTFVRVDNQEFKSVTFSFTKDGKRTDYTSEQIALQIIECKLEGVTNGEEFLDWLVSFIRL